MHETIRFVTFWSPGVMFGESWTADVASLDPRAVEWPKNAYAFTLHERIDVVEGAERFTGKARQDGPTYYHPDSKIETLAEVKANRPNETVLIRNMEGNGWAAVIWSRWGNWPQPFDPAKHEVLKRRRRASAGHAAALRAGAKT